MHKLDPDRLQIEAMVTPELDQTIDIVDSETACAYESRSPATMPGLSSWAGPCTITCLTFIVGLLCIGERLGSQKAIKSSG